MYVCMCVLMYVYMHLCMSVYMLTQCRRLYAIWHAHAELLGAPRVLALLRPATTRMAQHMLAQAATAFAFAFAFALAFGKIWKRANHLNNSSCTAFSLSMHATRSGTFDSS